MPRVYRDTGCALLAEAPPASATETAETSVKVAAAAAAAKKKDKKKRNKGNKKKVRPLWSDEPGRKERAHAPAPGRGA